MVYSQNNSHRDNDRIRYELKERIGVLGIKDNGWTKEVNLVSWNGAAPKVDIRDWDPSHERMAKGITMLEEEAEKLAKALAKRYGIGSSHDSSRNDSQAFGSYGSRQASGQTYGQAADTSRYDSRVADEPDVTPFEEVNAAAFDAEPAETAETAEAGEGSTLAGDGFQEEDSADVSTLS